MSEKKKGKATVAFSKPPCLLSYACAAGTKEEEGPLGGQFDFVDGDDTFGEKTWEKAESKMQQIALDHALTKRKLEVSNLQLIAAGDLLNQCIGSSFAHRDSNVPFLGLYGACSTMAQGLVLTSMLIDGGFIDLAAAIASSHFCSAERQYRFPLAYGGQRAPTAQWTVTGAGAVILSAEGEGVKVTHATIGKIVDMGVTDEGNMGGAMAPAAFDTLKTLFDDTGTKPSDYDLIATGDLGDMGAYMLRLLFEREGMDLGEAYGDCGLMIYDIEKQDVHAGASGCGCSAVVLCADILKRMEEQKLSKVIFAGTGALLSPVSTYQGESIPSICHAVVLER